MSGTQAKHVGTDTPAIVGVGRDRIQVVDSGSTWLPDILVAAAPGPVDVFHSSQAAVAGLKEAVYQVDPKLSNCVIGPTISVGGRANEHLIHIVKIVVADRSSYVVGVLDLDQGAQRIHDIHALSKIMARSSEDLPHAIDAVVVTAKAWTPVGAITSTQQGWSVSECVGVIRNVVSAYESRQPLSKRGSSSQTKLIRSWYGKIEPSSASLIGGARVFNGDVPHFSKPVQLKAVSSKNTPKAKRVTPAVASGASRNEELKKEFIHRYRLMNTAEFSTEVGSKAKSNLYAKASRLAKEGKVFSVVYQGRSVYPDFQLKDGKPRSVVRELINLFKTYFGESYEGWDLALFFYQPSSYLRGRSPAELLKKRDSDIEIMIAANAYLGIGSDV